LSAVGAEVDTAEVLQGEVVGALKSTLLDQSFDDLTFN
jgi:hypothetical protein